MKNRAIIIIVLLAFLLTPFGMVYADCDDHWEGACIALGATMLLNTILYGIPSPIVPPAATCYAPRRTIYYNNYCPPAVVEHYNYYYDCVPRVNVWIDHGGPYCYRPYWRRPRVYNYHYHYHYNSNHCRYKNYCKPHYRHHYHHHHHHDYRDTHYRHNNYCNPYSGNCYRPHRYIRY